jgi:3-hydroxyisobutyrate dehydrogenase
MGSGMAHHLLHAGYPLTVWNRTAARAQPLVELGATLADTPAEAVTEAKVVITMLGDDQASREVWLGPDGILAGQPDPETIAIESATISLAWVQELYQTLTHAHLRFIDCPVTGGHKGAEEGTLTLLVGADEPTLAEVRPMLETYSRHIIHFGPPGSGTAYKLVANLMGAAQTVALAEGLLLAERAGLNLDKVIEGLTNGAVASPLIKAWARPMVEQNHQEVSFSARWMHKDADYALRMAAEVGQAMPMSAVASQIYQMALGQGLGEKNVSAVIEALRSR